MEIKINNNTYPIKINNVWTIIQCIIGGMIIISALQNIIETERMVNNLELVEKAMNQTLAPIGQEIIDAFPGNKQKINIPSTVNSKIMQDEISKGRTAYLIRILIGVALLSEGLWRLRKNKIINEKEKEYAEYYSKIPKQECQPKYKKEKKKVYKQNYQPVGNLKECIKCSKQGSRKVNNKGEEDVKGFWVCSEFPKCKR